MGWFERRRRRYILLRLARDVERTFPEDWTRDLTIREVVRRWLYEEAKR